MRKILFCLYCATVIFNCKGKGLHVVPGFVKVPSVGVNLTGGFLEIHNNTDIDQILISANCEKFNVTEIHEMILEENMMKMRKMTSLKIKAGETLKLQPGGYHLMLINNTAEIKLGDTISCAVNFNENVKINIDLPVKNLPGHHAEH